ncbi:MurR/RpiR family transcriptional regulator, partial [Listeria monocytogenes]|nr:MurR/RpiR family transcriptional regulator [Listeria monocytogenes]
MTILNEIQQNYNRLPNKEKQIAKYILEKSDELKNINIKELAEETGTSISTITRFCRHVRCDSFVDLKMRVNTAATMVPSLGYDDLFEEVYSFYHKVID